MILDRSWIDFENRQQSRASASSPGFRWGTLPGWLGNVTGVVGERYRGG